MTYKKINIDTIKKYLEPGSVLLTSNHYSKTFIITPSPIKHGAIYFGHDIHKEINTLYNNIKLYLEYKKINLLKPKDEIYVPEHIKYLDNIYNIIDIKKLMDKLETLKDKYNSDNDYIVEISDKGPRILTFDKFIKNKNEIFIYHYYNKKMMKLASINSLYFLGTKYSFNKDKEGKYCFEMIIQSYEIIDKYFKSLKVSIIFDSYYTSSCFTKSRYFNLVYRN